MKKITNILCAALLTVALLFSMAGCSEPDPLVGTWETKISQAMLDAGTVSIKTDVWQYVDFSNVYQKETYVFRSSGQYTQTVDVEQYITDYLAAIEAGIRLYVQAEIDANNSDMTVDEVIAASGLTPESFVEADSLKELRENAVTTGNYKVSDGKLYLSAGVEYAVDENVYIVYSISGDQLTFERQYGAEPSLSTMALFPLTYTRIA